MILIFFFTVLHVNIYQILFLVYEFFDCIARKLFYLIKTIFFNYKTLFF